MITTRPTDRATIERLRNSVIDHASRREGYKPLTEDELAKVSVSLGGHEGAHLTYSKGTTDGYGVREFIPETVDELRATVQGMRDQLTMSLNAIPSGHGNAISGMIEHKWRARRDALSEVLTMIDNVAATQKATHKRNAFMRMCDKLGFTSPL